ncbi:GNAT family N-acetyltransferase [Cellulosilyticum lentocellum]|uniref:GCN5-related N-acetyltransferase n=1 Tax=Cellulosilyticum lentocellum (strain ATCC 49066 / DSM 5427 / NCIMB 11756 / RHM5) TaxID=642492 RepID=F2JIL1_CELLD|nr:GNAT family protein [Cellulosilyticum lentocellum]ADZ85481.1 GCN5-related N-acetyltransferase [Cellulosilyticum lentocellum DSM 5427]
MNIKLRKLKQKDAPLMLEWMQDKEITSCFRFDAQSMTIEKVYSFIEKAQDISTDMHLAIINEEDEYLGTISLKEIDSINHTAEYAISMRKCAIGSGVARSATEKLLDKAFNEVKINKVYLNVLSDNIRAIKFYEKLGFSFEGEFKDHLFINGKYKSIKWYGIFKVDFMKSI